MPRAPRLSRQQIVESALRLAQDAGIGAVSMRRVAADLGASPMALYRHVRNIDDLFSAMVDASGPATDLAAIDPDAPWQQRLRTAALAVYERMRTDREIVELAMTRGMSAAWEAEVMERIAAILVDGGASSETAVAFSRFLFSSMGALVLAEIWSRIPSDEVWDDVRNSFLASGVEAGFPIHTAGREALLPPSRQALAEEFADFILDAARGAIARDLHRDD